MDPRVKTSPEDLRRQFELDRKIADALHRDYEAVQQVRSLRCAIEIARHERRQPEPGDRHEGIGDLEAKAAALEGDEGGYGTRYLSTPEGRSLARLNSGLSSVLSALDTPTPRRPRSKSPCSENWRKRWTEQLVGVGPDSNPKTLPN